MADEQIELIELSHPADRLIEAINRKGAPVCVGLDPVIERLPDALQPAAGVTGVTGVTGVAGAVGAIEAFCHEVLNAVAPHVPCVKFQSACFERYHAKGIEILDSLIAEAKSLGLEVILDAKRGDIGISAEHYAAAAFDDSDERASTRPDWLTVNPYLGSDAIEPFLQYNNCGVFSLVRTSNPGSAELQARTLDDGSTVAEATAQMIAKLGSNYVGQSGYSAIGAVVGATQPQAACRLRALMHQQIFLVPGFGAQGGTIEDVMQCFNEDGTGALITASRSVIYAFDAGDTDWCKSIAEAAASLSKQFKPLKAQG